MILPIENGIDIATPEEMTSSPIAAEYQIYGSVGCLPLRVRHSLPASLSNRMTSPLSDCVLRSFRRADRSTSLAASPFFVLLNSSETSSALSPSEACVEMPCWGV